MDSNNWQVQIPNLVIGAEAVAAGGMGGGDWRTELYPDARQRIVLKIMEILKRHLPFTGQEGLQATAVRFEEEIYTTATSQSDYLREISLKMLTMETKSPDPMANSYQSSAPSNSENPQYPESADSSSQNASGGDWQEEIYQKIKSMNEMYFPELNEIYQRMAAKLQQHDALPQQRRNEQLEKLRFFKCILERLVFFLRTNKNDIQLSHKEKIVGVEKQIVNILTTNRPRKPVASVQQGQLAQPNMHAMQQPIPQTHTNDGQLNSQLQLLKLDD